jgi:hypothetical protein
MAFISARCSVEAVCPPGHPVAAARGVSRIHRYRAFAPVRSVSAAIASAQPNFIVPCDDRATALLHRLHERAFREGKPAAATRALLERSLGQPSSFPVAKARDSLMALARQQGIRVPDSAVVRTAEELGDWFARHGCPAVLKADGTNGGRGVRIVDTPADGVRALRTLSRPPTLRRALRRAAINRDTNDLQPFVLRTRSLVSVQRFVAGQDANSTVACWNGKVLAAITVGVLRQSEPNGPASVVRLIDNPEMSAAVEQLAGQLKLSGLFGFDFVIEQRTREAYLVEMNPRATPICHLPLGEGRDLPASLRAMLSGEPVVNRPPATENEIIAFFPQEWQRDPRSDFLRTAYHDVPWDEPGFLRACIREDQRLKAWTSVTSAVRAPAALLKRQVQ